MKCIQQLRFVPRWWTARRMLALVLLTLTLLSCSVDSAVMVGDQPVSWSILEIQESDPPGQFHDKSMHLLAIAGIIIVVALVAGTGNVGGD